MPAMALAQELVRDFVLAGHGNFDKVKSMLAAEPALLNEKFVQNDETALDAASHVGNRAIAEYLLEQGAPLNLYTAAMLGRTGAVADILRRDPAAAGRPGVHGMSALFHAAIGGHTAIADMLYAGSANENMGNILHAAVASGNIEMVRWALAQKPDVTTKRFDGKTPMQVAAGQAEIEALLREAGATE